MSTRVTAPLQRAGLALAAVACLLPGCAGDTAGLCAGVSCAPGRICVQGVCQPAGDPWLDSGGFKPDLGAPPTDTLVADTADAADADAAAADALVPDSATPPDVAPPPDLDVGRWYQANQANCPTYCAGKGLTNQPSPDGCRCMSGEARPKSGIAGGIVFTYGTTGTGQAQQGITTSSYGKYCYQPGQKQDDDKTDYTVGCFCR